jgi:hypothetical protein
VWPADFADASEWTVTLSAAERGEIIAAAGAAAGSGLTAAMVRREDFPLPGLAAAAMTIYGMWRGRVPGHAWCHDMVAPTLKFWDG